MVSRTASCLLLALLATPAAVAADWELDVAGLVGASPRRLWACGETLIVQDANHAVTAVAPATGDLLWTVRLTGPLGTAPVAGHGTVTLSAGRQLVVVEAASGRSLVKRRLVSVPGAAPVADAGLVFVPSTIDDTLLALVPGRDVPAWRYRHDGGFVAAAALVGAGDRRLVVVPALDGTLRALPAQRTLPGEEGWVTHTGRLLGDPVRRGHDLLVGATGGMVGRVEGATGRFVWRRLLGAPLSAAPAAGDELVLAATTGALVGLAWSDGRSLWESGPAGAPLGVAGPVVVVRSDDGTLALLDADDGTAVGRLARPVQGAAVHGRQLVLLSEGRLVAREGRHLAR